jgi:hypothetical protein
LTGELPVWEVPLLIRHEPTAEDVATSRELGERYQSILAAHFLGSS